MLKGKLLSHLRLKYTKRKTEVLVPSSYIYTGEKNLQ